MNKNTKTHSLEIAPPKVSAPADTSEKSEELAAERVQEMGEEKTLVEKEHHKVQGWVQDWPKSKKSGKLKKKKNLGFPRASS